MKKIVLVYGLIAGVIVSTIMAISMAYHDSCNNNTSSMVVGYASMVLAFSMIFVAIKSYKDKQLNGFISFGKAFKVGLLIALIASTMYVIVWGIEYNYFLPGFADKYANSVVEQAKKAGSAEAIQKAIQEGAMVKKLYANPFSFALITYTEILPVGLIVSLIAALILKRKKTETAV
jgi:hypothetical protein